MKPDLRNLAKACEDALQFIIFVNDSQVIDAGRDTKRFANTAFGFTEIMVVEL